MELNGGEHTRPTVPAPRSSAEHARESETKIPSAPRQPAANELESGVYQALFSESDVAERLGGLHRIPVVTMATQALRDLPLDPSSAFLNGQMDGMVTIEMLIDMAPMSRSDVLRSLMLLVQYGVVGLQ